MAGIDYDSPARMRILVVGDSLAFHRGRAVGQRLDQAWPWQLKEQLPDAELWVRSQTGSLAPKVRAEVELFEPGLDLFDAIVVQAGINDSTPRPMPLPLYNFLCWAGGRKLGKLINQNYPLLLRLYRRTWTTEASYRASLEAIVAKAAQANPETKVVFVPILPPCKRLAAMVGRARPPVERYNEILREVCAAASNAVLLREFSRQCGEDLILEDGHHLTELGHRLLASQLARVIGTSARTRYLRAA